MGLKAIKGEIYGYTYYHTNTLSSYRAEDLVDLSVPLSLDDHGSSSRSEGAVNCTVSM
jgi:hypothetical protein